MKDGAARPAENVSFSPSKQTYISSVMIECGKCFCVVCVFCVFAGQIFVFSVSFILSETNDHGKDPRCVSCVRRPLCVRGVYIYIPIYR